MPYGSRARLIASASMPAGRRSRIRFAGSGYHGDDVHIYHELNVDGRVLLARSPCRPEPTC